jgi:hypothetical protein
VTLSPRVVVPLYRLAFGTLVPVAIIVQMVSLAQSGVLDPLHYLTFFTNLSNEIAAIVFLVGAARWRSARSRTLDIVRGGAVVYMTITGVVFAVLLSGVNVDAQIPWVNDVIHELFPIVVMADWLIDPPAERLTLQQGTVWLSFPAAWLAYELIRGAISNKYHYPFLNPAHGGYGTVVLYCVAIFVFALVVCAVVVWLANIRRPAEAPRRLE